MRTYVRNRVVSENWTDEINGNVLVKMEVNIEVKIEVKLNLYPRLR